VNGRTTSALVAACLVCGARPLAAQVTASLDLASGNASFDGLQATTIMVVSPGLQLQGGRWSGGVTGNYTAFDRGGWSGQGSLAASWFTPAAGPLVGEVSARLDHSVRAQGPGSGQALGHARAHLHGDGRGLWVGTARGGSWSALGRDGVSRVDAGIWARLSAARWTLQFSRGTSFDTMPLADSPVLTSVVQGRRIRSEYGEASTTLEWAGGPFEASGSLARRVERASQRSNSWHVAGTWWVTRFLGVIGGAGRYSPDRWQAHPGGQYYTLALRVGLQPASRARLRPAPAEERAPSVTLFEAVEVDAGVWLVRIMAPQARRVELAGDFSDWQPLQLEAGSDGAWSVTLPLASGTYRMNVRIDGARWTVPPGLGSTEDDFAGRVGLLVLARR
jgi:hypothetical protein